MSRQETGGALSATGKQGIPHIIHQIWKNEEIPHAWLDFADSWKRLNPDWEYRLWTDKAVKDFVTEKYPGLLEVYDAFSYDIQRADLARYLILHACGGVYADLDIECLLPVSGLLFGRTFVACHEPKKHARMKGVKEMVCNAFMASVPAHPLIEKVIDAVAAAPAAITLHMEVLTSTGPLMLTRVMGEYGRNDIDILGAEVASPFESDSEKLERLLERGEEAAGIKEELIRSGCYAIHYWSNSWGRNLAGSLRNPHPNRVEGYQFYPGWDSPGFDIKNGGRDVEMLSRECDRMEEGFGFNTDGFIKYRLRPWFRWTRIEGSNEHAWSRWSRTASRSDNEGLYVKKGHLPLLKKPLLLYFLETATLLKERLAKKRLHLREDR